MISMQPINGLIWGIENLHYFYFSNRVHAQSRPFSNNDFEWSVSRADVRESNFLWLLHSRCFQLKRPNIISFSLKTWVFKAFKGQAGDLDLFYHEFWMRDFLASGHNLCAIWKN